MHGQQNIKIKCDIGMVGAEAKILTLRLKVIRRSK
jgi:hypothetical protein